MSHSHELIEEWRKCRCNLNELPYIFPCDQFLREKEWDDRSCQLASFEDYISNEFDQERYDIFHFGLIPIPYMGNLETASIFLLMLNPGFHPGDYFAEYNVPYFRQAIISNLHQEYTNDEEYPFTFLNPAFAWHPGFGYWYRKLYGVLKDVGKRSDIQNHSVALSYLAKRIVTLELVPYHSTRFSGKGFQNFESVKLMQEFVRNIVIPKAKSGEAVVIATRSAEVWNLPSHENVVIYTAGEARAAHLTPSSKGGKAILRQLGG